MAKEPLNSPFPETKWTVVLKTRSNRDEPATSGALARLCTDYWYPLYAFARRSGQSPPDAEDATQSFFAYALERNLFASAEPQLGRLRSFLLKAFERHIADATVRDGSWKRGGRCEFISIEVGEARYAAEKAEAASGFFERTWAYAVLDSTLSELGVEEEAAGRGETFRVLEAFIWADVGGEAGYADAGARLGMTEAAARQWVGRLRGRFREVLRRRIADTLHNPTNSQIDSELATLRDALHG
ncbi:MAG: sigma-70 family RNA polymerase sigma factor [Chthoniobacteraceae bacterium]